MRICLVGWDFSTVADKRAIGEVVELCRMYGHEAASLKDDTAEGQDIFWTNHDTVASCDVMLVNIGSRSQLNQKMSYYYYEIGSAFNAGKLILAHDDLDFAVDTARPEEYICTWASGMEKSNGCCVARKLTDANYQYVRYRTVLRVMIESWRNKYGQKAPYPIDEGVAFGSVRDCLCAIEWIERHNESAAQREVVRPYEARI